jgi:hypothetical protein
VNDLAHTSQQYKVKFPPKLRTVVGQSDSDAWPLQ